MNILKQAIGCMLIAEAPLTQPRTIYDEAIEVEESRIFWIQLWKVSKMTWDYSELNPLPPVLSGTFRSMFLQFLRPLEHSSQITRNENKSIITQSSATHLLGNREGGDEYE